MAAHRSGQRLTTMLSRLRAALSTADRAAGGLAADVVAYAIFTVFAVWTATSSTLAPHRTWGAIATYAYAAAALLAVAQLVLRLRAGWWPRLTGPGARFVVTGLAWLGSTVAPLVIEASQRVDGRTGRAQEEVLVIEDAGHRMLATGSPYLGRAAIAALPAPDRLLGYLPYQPGMALFGLPRALDTRPQWWSDARVWFAVVTTAALVTALVLLWRGGVRHDRLVRAAQVATVLPLCALTLATGGDDLPVLALCLLAFALAARGRPGWAGLSVGAAAALKLFAWPVVLVLGVSILAGSRRPGALGRYAIGALGLPVAFLIPAVLVDADAVVENVLRFPFGHGLVTSPAQSPLLGYLIAAYLPHGRTIAIGLLAIVGVAIAVGLLRRPPRTAAIAALISGYGLLAALLLMPSTRFGYLLYPAAFLVWGAALASGPAGSRTGFAPPASTAPRSTPPPPPPR